MRFEKFLEESINAHNARRKGMLKNGRLYLYNMPDTLTVKRKEIKAPTIIKMINSRFGA